MLIFLSPLLGAAFGFAIGALVRQSWRRPLLLLGLLLPLAVYTFDLGSAQPSEPGFFYWWFAGLFVVGPVLILAALLTTAGYLGGAYLARINER